jgi:oligosaccharide repeat unit polymerase
MDAVDFSILTLLIACIVILLVGYFSHHRDIVNPITAFVIMQLMLMGFVSAASSRYAFNVFDVTGARLADAVWVHLVYGLAVVVGYFFKPIHIPIGHLIQLLSKKSISLRTRLVVRIALILGAILAMLMLVFSGPEGILWLTDPRYAYIRLRAGSGQWWVLYQICVVLLFVKTLFEGAKERHFYFRVLKIVLFYGGLMYFTGSKSAVLIIPIIATLYIHFNFRRLKLSSLLGFFSLAIIGFILLLSEGKDIDLVGNVFRYFADYVAVTALNMEQIDIQGLTLGQSTLSSLWYWVPRSLMIDKPFEWGTTFLNGVLFPGSAEQGHTPGVLSWITYYMDFGLIGVILNGVFLGSFSHAVYCNFLKTRDAGSFLLMIPFCFFIVPVSAGSSTLFIVMTLFLWLFDGKRDSRVIRRVGSSLQDETGRSFSPHLQENRNP